MYFADTVFFNGRPWSVHNQDSVHTREWRHWSRCGFCWGGVRQGWPESAGDCGTDCVSAGIHFALFIFAILLRVHVATDLYLGYILFVGGIHVVDSSNMVVFVQVVPLKENGAELDVTEENKMEYLDLLAQHRLARSVKEEIDAFLKGIVAQPTQLHIVITSARCHTEFWSIGGNKRWKIMWS